MTRSKIASGGFSESMHDPQIAAGRWQPIGPRVVVLHNGPLTSSQLCWSAVLNAGRPAALAAWTAAERHGLKGYGSDRIHVLVPRGARVPALDRVVVHESRRFSSRDLSPTHRPACVTAERAIVDMALWSATSRGGCAVLAAGVQQRVVTPHGLRTKVTWPRTGRHRGVLLATLTDIGGGAEALSELDFAAYCRRHDLPEPRRQAVRTDGAGRRRYLDADFDGFSVEIDGAIHLRPVRAWADMERHNSLVLIGERQLHFPSFLVYLDDPVIAIQIRAALGRFSQTPPREETARSA
jgi:hypothetical protein